MPFEVRTEEDLDGLKAEARKRAAMNGAPRLLNVNQVMELATDKPQMLIESMLSTPGLTLLNAPAKTGKTILAAQAAMSIATGVALFEFYQIYKNGPVLFVEKDDPTGAASIRDLMEATALPIKGKPFHTVATEDARKLELGPEMALWLDAIIPREGFRLVVLDSYTALRGIRGNSGDFVKKEAADLTILDELAKKHGTTILLLHHYSKGSASADWSERAAGSYAITAASEAQIVIHRFSELASNAPERLVRVRGRRFEGVEMVLRFNRETLSYEHVLEGPAAPLFVELQQIHKVFGGRTFSPKSLQDELGLSRATAYRLLARLLSAGAVNKINHGEYRLGVTL